MPFYLLSFLLISCAHYSPNPKHMEGLIFPYGTYQHKVHFEMKKPVQQNIRMLGVVSIKDQRLSVVGLSPFNTTLFRIVDNFKSEPEITIFEPRMKPLNEYLLKYYKMMKKVLLVDQKNLPKQIKDENGQTVDLIVTDYDDKGIPRLISLKSENYKIKIAVSDYELEKP